MQTSKNASITRMFGQISSPNKLNSMLSKVFFLSCFVRTKTENFDFLNCSKASENKEETFFTSAKKFVLKLEYNFSAQNLISVSRIIPQTPKKDLSCYAAEKRNTKLPFYSGVSSKESFSLVANLQSALAVLGQQVCTYM